MKTEDLKRYGYELPRNGVANDLRTRVVELEAENNQLRGLLWVMVKKHGAKFFNNYFTCATCGKVSTYDSIKRHTDGCAYIAALMMLEGDEK